MKIWRVIAYAYDNSRVVIRELKKKGNSQIVYTICSLKKNSA